MFPLIYPIIEVVASYMVILEEQWVISKYPRVYDDLKSNMRRTQSLLPLLITGAISFQVSLF